MTPSPWLAPSVSAHASALGMVHAQRSTRPLFAIIVIITCPFMGVAITTLQRRRRQRAGSGWHRWHSVSRPSWDATWLPGPLLRCTTVSHANCVLSSSCQKTSPCHLHRGARGGCSHVGRRAGAGGSFVLWVTPGAFWKALCGGAVSLPFVLRVRGLLLAGKEGHAGVNQAPGMPGTLVLWAEAGSPLVGSKVGKLHLVPR